MANRDENRYGNPRITPQVSNSGQDRPHVQSARLLSAMPNSILSDIRAVVFDAVGTVMYPNPSVAEAYCAAMTRFCHVDIPANTVSAAVRDALQGRASGDLATSEAAERDFWAGLIQDLAGESSGFQDCFDHLFAHFADAANWRCFPETEETIDGLHSAGLRTAIASNFDLRLNSVCDGLPGLKDVPHRVISSVVGWRKPDVRFFEAVCRHLELRPQQVLFVGDDLVNDVEGSLTAGMKSVWLCRNGDTLQAPEGATVVATLTDLI